MRCRLLCFNLLYAVCAYVLKFQHTLSWDTCDIAFGSRGHLLFSLWQTNSAYAVSQGHRVAKCEHSDVIA